MICSFFDMIHRRRSSLMSAGILNTKEEGHSVHLFHNGDQGISVSENKPAGIRTKTDRQPLLCQGIVL